MRSVALRFGMFVPEPFLHSGIRFLYGGVDQRDVASAVVAALNRARGAPPGAFAAYNVFSALPFDSSDASVLPLEPLRVVRRHWPDAPDLLRDGNVELWGPIHDWYDIGKARRELDWHPLYGFDAFLQALREGRRQL